MAKKKDPKNLNELAKDWAPEQAPLKLEEAPAPAKKGKTEKVTLITDPYQFKNQEISEAQNSDDELGIDDELDESLVAEDYSAALKESDEQLGKLEKTMQAEEDRNVEELTEQAEVSKEDLEKELAAQIAEDEALKKLEAEEAQKAQELTPELMAALPKRDENNQIDPIELQSCIETLLFMTEKPVTLNRLRDWLVIELKNEELKEALSSLQERYKDAAHGFELVEVAGGYQFRTKAIRAALAMRLAKVQTQRLSRGAMESLAIVAYKQPALKEDIDKIRGVDSSHFIRTLLDKKLIHMSGRSELPGRPILYSTTQDFLEIFGLTELAALPPLRELEQMIPGSETGDPADEDPKVKEMRRLVAEMKANKQRITYDPKEDEKLLSDIRERVKGISTTTPYLEALEAAENGEEVSFDTGPTQPELKAETPILETAPDAAAEAPTEEEAPAIPQLETESGPLELPPQE